MIFVERYATDSEFVEFIAESRGISIDSIEITEDPERKIQFVEFLWKGTRYKIPNHLKVTERWRDAEQGNSKCPA